MMDKHITTKDYFNKKDVTIAKKHALRYQSFSKPF